MTVIKLAVWALQASLSLAVCSLGLQTSMAEATSLFRRPRLLAWSILAMNVVIPALAVFAAATLPLNPVVKIGVVVLAVSPVPLILPRAQMKLGGTTRYAYALLVAVALLSIIALPLTLELLGKLFVRDIHMGVGQVVRITATSILLPLAAGMLLARLAPTFAKKLSAPLAGVGFLLLFAFATMFLFADFPGIVALIGDGTILAIASFVVAAVAVGHWMGGPDPSGRSVLALTAASRHPGLVLGIAGANFPAQRSTLAAAVLLYLVVRTMVLVPYNAWRKRARIPSIRNTGSRSATHTA
jgi:bile acid:Na+ symporter, BASS family